MGYFPSDAEARAYRQKYCSRCVHEDGCVVWSIQLSRNVEDANKKIAGIHLLIPRSETANEECAMFHECEAVSPWMDEYEDQPRECGCRHDRRQHRIQDGRVYCTACGVFCRAEDLLAVMDSED